jgi:two-component system nitrate/nitrite response regulator NarL
MIRAVVIDDHELFRLGVIDTLEVGGDAVVVGQGATAGEALRLARTELPDVLLLDLGLPDRSGLEVVEELVRERAACRIVVLTVSEEDESLFRALEAGAAAYIVKGVEREELLHAVRAVATGERYVSPRLAADLLLRLAPGFAPATVLADLSAREEEVLERISRGQTNREIGEALSLSEKTVKHYVTNLLVKLNARNRVEAALVGRSVLAQRARART